MNRSRRRVVHHRAIRASRPDRAGDARRDDFGLQLGPWRIPHAVLLLLILAAGAAVRFAGIDWGANWYLHPDERFMTMVEIGIHWPGSVSAYFDSATSTLNPYNNNYGSYVYGTLPLFLAKLIGTISNDLVYGDAHLPGRWLSAVTDLGSVALVYWIARRLFSSKAGLVAAVLLAFAPLHIQTAHYFTTDSPAAFFAVATFAAVLKAWSGRSWRWFAIAGLCAGMATACKPTLLLTAGLLALPVLEMIRLFGVRSLLPPWHRVVKTRRDAAHFPILLAVALAGVCMAVAFRVAQPYAFAGPHFWNVRLDARWTDTLDYWRQVQSGAIDLPPGIQWADRTPLVFVLDNMVRWGMGPALGIVALIAVIAFSWRIVVARRWPSWWMLGLVGWVLFHIVFYGTALVKTQRYLLPAYPFMIVLAAGFLDGLPDRLHSARWKQAWPRLLSWLPAFSTPRWLRVGGILTVLVIAGTIFSGAALTNIYLKPQTRVAASEWIFNNIPAGSAISSEYWDDGLPIPLPQYPAGQYVHVQMAPYDADTEAKLSRFIGQLHQLDYIILSSDRLVGSIPRMPDRYPMMTAYYDALVSGDLGFELVAEFKSPPELFGITLDDTGAEEALTVYDHPHVRIFRKTDAFSTNDTWYMLHDALGDGAMSRRVIDLPQSTMMMSAQERVDQVAHGTWRDIFSPDGVTSNLPGLWWYLVLQMFVLPAIPICWRLFPALPDRGYALAKTVGILGVAWISWLLASLHLIDFSRTGIVVAWILATLVGLVALHGYLREIAGDLRRRWRWLVATEALFLVAFAAIVWLRMLNPDLWQPGRGGEKPMELAIFNAILRSDTFPPFDPWFSGGNLHYYYFGYVPWATVSRLTGIVPEIAFNLAFPSLYALLLVNVWMAAAALIGRMRRNGNDGVAGSIAGWRTILAALLAPLMVGLLGNLDFVRRLGRGEWGYPATPSWLEPFGDPGRIAWGIWNAILDRGNLPNSAYWDPTRVIPNTINEFPYFSLLFGDLHAHLLAMPLISASILIAIGIALMPTSSLREASGALLETVGGWRRMLPLAVLAGFVSGALVATNTWDYPPSVALIVAAVVIVAFRDLRGVMVWRRVRDVVVFAVVVVVAGRVLFQPYLSHYGSIPFSTQPGTETTRLADYLTIHGVMLVAIAALLVVEIGRYVLAVSRQSSWPVAAASAGMVVLVVLYALAFVLGNTALFLMAGMLTLVVVAGNQRDRPARLMWLAMIGLALVLALVPERLRLENDVGRMNLVFKFYLHAWQLLGIAAAVAVVQVTSLMLRGGEHASGERGVLSGDSRSVASIHNRSASQGAHADQGIPSSMATRLGGVAGRIWLVALCVLVLGAASYPVLVTGPRLADRFNSLDPTLDGLAYMDNAIWAEGPAGGAPVTFALARDREAIDWLRHNVDGTPVILEAQLPAYRWGGRISSTTGLPTVLGWTWHEIQQRPGYGAQVQERVDDIERIYGSYQNFDAIKPILDRYHVELIYVGDLELALYGAPALEKFADAAERGDLNVVYDHEGVIIYAIPSNDAGG